MTARSRRSLAALLAPLVVAPFLLAWPSPAAAGTAPPPAAECEGLPNIADLQPVLLVHGFMSGPSTWSTPPETEGGEATAGRLVTKLVEAGAYVDDFDYERASTNWVDHPEIGPALADKISEVSRTSLCGGGSGKVAIVAHSMGGLAVRCALALSCGGRPAMEDKVGLVITMGTPHTGAHVRGGSGRDLDLTALGVALWAACGDAVPYTNPDGLHADCLWYKNLLVSDASRAFAFGSDELERLPPFPEGVPVRALAGQMNFTRRTLFGNKRTYDIGDSVVGVDSATAVFTDGPLGGKHQFQCGSYRNQQCSHTDMTNHPFFVDDAARTIEAYMASKEVREAAEQEKQWKDRAAGGVLGAPTGPVLKVSDAVGSFPFAAQAIAAETYVEFAVPAPPGQEWAVVALQLRPLVHDRSWQVPEAMMFNLQWPDEECRSYLSDDLYACTTSMVEAVSSYLPVDAQAWDDPRAVEGGGIADQGQRYDVVIKALVPEEFDLAQARLQVPLRATARGSDEWIPLAGLPQFDQN